MVAPTSSGGTFVVVNYTRVDQPAWSLDQDPFGAIIHSTGADAQGMFVYHGGWTARTIQPSTDFWDHVDESGIGAHYPHANLPPSTSGPLSDLYGKGHLEAIGEFKLRIRSGHP